ncbi:PREDICTED: uncharacterized protein LOC108762626 [Trachymyrmex cornetzi]|uniref:uncharacterized protein LOC108762626 n=1 Tax=Trachymyrmex cornetzi TaxID=471704 RepID=UPI00084F1328|nr:PREDICTED: uncharacterized protein LOC108762626 [Trachymyrmex cornetzi]
MASEEPNKEINVWSGKGETIHNINIGNMILSAFKSKPDFVGQINAVTEEQTTYQQMRENSVKCALWFQQLRCKKNIIAICTRHKMLEYIPFLASLYVGAIVNTWDEKNMINAVCIANFLTEYRPNIIFIDSHNYSRLKMVLQCIDYKDSEMNPPKIITFDRIEGVDCLESILNNDFEKTKIDEFSCVKMKPNDIVAKMFSHSATGDFDNKVYICCFAFTYPSNQEVPVMSSGDIGLWYASLNWSYGMILTVRCIISYVTVIKCSKFSDENMYETIQKYKESDKKIDILSGTEDLLHNINIGNMILKAFESKPNFVGQIDAMTEEQTTYQQMRENSVKCALWFQQLRCKKNIIAICTRHKMLEYIPFLASLYIGAIINSWDKKYMEDRIRIMYFLLEYEPDIIFIDSDNYKELKLAIKIINAKINIDPPKIITFDRIEGVDSLESILNNDFEKTKIDEFSCMKMEPLDIVAIMFSPSATSYPNSKIFIRCFALTYPSNQEVPVMFSGDIGLWYASLNWSYGVILTVRCIISYVTVIKCPKFSDKNMYETIEKYKFLEIYSQKILGPCRTGTIWYKFIFKWCSPQTCKLQNCYNYRAKKNTIGKNIKTYFSKKWQCTGDYGYYDKNGEIFLIDKIKDLIKYRVFHLSPTKIENTLLRHPAVSEVVVRSVPHPINGQHPVAYVKKECGAEVDILIFSVTEKELITFVANELPEIYQLRGGVHFKICVPYLPNGKIDRMLAPGYTSLY